MALKREVTISRQDVQKAMQEFLGKGGKIQVLTPQAASFLNFHEADWDALEWLLHGTSRMKGIKPHAERLS